MSRERNDAQLEELLRFCMKQERGGGIGPGGIVCTGAFDPYHLRSGESEYEEKIQEILRKNKIYGIGR